MIDLRKKAISAALNCRWEEAIDFNKEILEKIPDDIDTINRISKAYFELGQANLAKRMNKKALSLDPLNTIAQKNSQRFEEMKDYNGGQRPPRKNSFLEVPGKTKVVALINLGEKSVLASFDPGEKMHLSVSQHRVCLNTPEGKYIGRFPDDIASKLIKFTKAGIEYEVLIKSSHGEKITVFIRETVRPNGTESLLSL